MNNIVELVKHYITKAGEGKAELDEKTIEEFGEKCKEIIRRRFTPSEPRAFTIRASNIGRPLCQLQHEKAGTDKPQVEYHHIFKMFIGDMIEAAAVAVMKGAGVNVQDEQVEVNVTLPEEVNGEPVCVSGTLDVIIDDGVYDIKSASPFAFEYKFNNENGFDRILHDDPFGYLTQGYLYSEGSGYKFKGWIAINKSTGEWAVLETPFSDTGHRRTALRTASRNSDALITNKPFVRCFDPEEETFNGKKTGNRILPITCSFCPYKKACWEKEGLTYAENPRSKAKYKQKRWYLGPPR